MNWNKMLLMLLAVFPLVAPAYAAVCELPDNGAGTIDLPPDCPHGYIGQMSIVNGLPPGTTIESDAVLRNFFNVVRTPGGSLGGEIQTWQAQLEMAMTGTGTLAGYSRFIVIGVQGETHSAPNVPWQPVQSFDFDLVQMFGQVLGDPDFDLLRVTAGANYGLPSPGHTTLTQLPGGDWAVDSFFDITYRIDFIGAPGGPLAGMSGSTTLVSHFQAGGSYPSELAEAPGSSRFILLANTPNPFSSVTTIEYYAPPQRGSVKVTIFDVAGHVVRTLTPGLQSPGLQRVEWNGRDERGLLAGTGVYFYRLQAPGFEKSMKMMMCR
ncbi:MAG: FlgD immunoglobulin-like domain containing protein [Candidatus Eisenbacteria bacterium]